MKTIKTALALALVGVTMASCLKERPSGDGTTPGGLSIPLTVSCELLDDEAPLDTKSLFTNNPLDPDCDLRRITDINYYLFQNGILRTQEYFASAKDFSVTLPDPDGTYDLFLLANAGRKAVSSSLPESDMAGAVKVEYEMDTYLSTIKSKGFPMATIIRGFSRNSGTNHTMKRLVHELRLNLADNSGFVGKITSVRVRQAPRDVFPFMEKSKSSENLETNADPAGSADYAVSSESLDGEQVRLYILENMRGDLLPGNTDWSMKTMPVDAPYTVREEFGKATYIEIEAFFESDEFIADKSIYRCYLGKSPSNFDVERSKYTTLNASFSASCLLNDRDWTKEVGDVWAKSLEVVPLNCYDLITAYGFPLRVQLQSPYQFAPADIDIYDANNQSLTTAGNAVGGGRYEWTEGNNTVSYDKATCTFVVTKNTLPSRRVEYDAVPVYNEIVLRVKDTEGRIDQFVTFKEQDSRFNLDWTYNTDNFQRVTLRLEKDTYCSRFFSSKNLPITFRSIGGYVYEPGVQATFFQLAYAYCAFIAGNGERSESILLYNGINKDSKGALDDALEAVSNRTSPATKNFNFYYGGYLGNLNTIIYLGEEIYDYYTKPIFDFPYWELSEQGTSSSSYQGTSSLEFIGKVPTGSSSKSFQVYLNNQLYPSALGPLALVEQGGDYCALTQYYIPECSGSWVRVPATSFTAAGYYYPSMYHGMTGYTNKEYFCFYIGLLGHDVSSTPFIFHYNNGPLLPPEDNPFRYLIK